MSIGQDIPRVDGLAKLSGRALYVDDLPVPGVLHGGTVRTPIARGRIKAVRFDPSIDWSQYVIVDHRDVPGANQVALIERDQPALVASEFRHRFEPVLLLAHRSPGELRRGLRGVRIDVEALPAVLDPLAPLAPELIQHANDNVFKRIEIRKGDAAAQFARAAHVISGEYRTGAQEHVYIETQGMLAHEQDGVVIVQGGMQCPYYVLDSLTNCFGRPREAFRVIQTPTGGGFGGKEDYPSILAIHAVLLSLKAGAPVKIVYDRQEDMAATTKRHPSVVRHRTALDHDGRLLAMEVEVILDGGAYVTLSPVVLSRGVIHAVGPYHCDHVHIRGEARLTNTPPNGAFRGFGAPQVIFALERHLDEIARRIGLPPAELRRRNLLHSGQSTATDQVFRDGVDLAALQDHALRVAQYEDRRQRYAIENAAHPYLRRGIGLSTFMHGAGFTGGGETKLASEVWVEGLPDGRVEVLTAQTDFGQGTETILAQAAAERLGADVRQVRCAVPDTSRVPNSGPTVASRTAMVVGRLVERACDDLLMQVQRGDSGLADALRAWHAAHPGERLLGKARYTKPAEIQWDDATYKGDAYACYSYATYVADVEVDLRTFGVRVCDFVAVQEVGRVIHPVLARGQIAGGVVQGIGWALMEELVLEQGGMRNAQMTNYIIPTSGDLPPIRVYFAERPSAYGPGGAKGIGELPMDGPAPAILNAVCEALGVSLNEIPLTPERLMRALGGPTHGPDRTGI